MTLTGYDSAFGPTAGQLAGVGFWFGYLGGPGAYHTWRPAEWAVLKAAGVRPGGLWVPTFGLTENATQAAADTIGAAGAAGIFRAVGLDTEQAMTGPRLVSFVDNWCAEIARQGWTPHVYTGAHYAPSGVATFDPWWGTSRQPVARQAIQYGPNATNTVDVDLADPAFPFGAWTPALPPPPVPPTPTLEIEMVLIRNPEGMVSLFDGTHKVGVQSSADMAAFQAAGIQVVPVSDAQYNHIPDVK